MPDQFGFGPDEPETSKADPFGFGPEPEESLASQALGAGKDMASKALGIGGSVLSTVGNTLGIPQQLLFGAIDAAQRGRTIDPKQLAQQAVAPLTQDAKPITGERLLTQAGWEGDSWGKWGTGLAVDMLVDPLNVFGSGAVKAGIKASAPVRVAGNIADKALMNPTVAKVMRPVANVGSRDYQKFKYLEMAKKRAAEDQAIQRVAKGFAPVAASPEDLLRTQAALNTGDIPEDIAPVVAKLREHFDDLFKRGGEAGVVDPATYRRNYAPRVTAPKGDLNLVDVDESPFTVITNPHAKPRVLDEAANTTKDPVIAAATHALRQEALIGNVNFIRGAAQKFGAISDAPVEGMRKLKVTAGTIPFGKEVQQMHFPEVIASDIEYLLDHRYELGDIGKAVRAVNGYWKHVTTTINPAFHSTNAVGNVAQMTTLGRMNPAMVVPRMVQAQKLANGTLPKGTRFGKFSADQAAAEAAKYGISGVNAGQFTNLDTGLTDIMRQHGANPEWRLGETALGKLAHKAKAVAQIPSSIMGKLGSTVENNSKMALFLDGLSRGLSPEDATLLVRKALFDYNEVPDAVRWSRDLITPYITWLYKNVPAQMKMMMDAPERAALAPKLQRAMTGEDPYTNEQVPAYARERGMVDTGEKTKQGAHLLLDPNLPAQDLEMFQGIAAGRPDLTLRGLAGQVSPLWALPTEYVSGQDIRSGRPLWPEYRQVRDPNTGELMETARSKAPDALAALDALLGTSITTPMVTSSGEVQRTVSPTTALAARRILPNLASQAGRAAIGMTELGDDGTVHEGFSGSGDEWRGIPLPLLTALQRIATGMTMTPVTPAQAQRNQEFLYKDLEAMLNKAYSVKGRTLPPTGKPPASLDFGF